MRLDFPVLNWTLSYVLYLYYMLAQSKYPPKREWHVFEFILIYQFQMPINLYRSSRALAFVSSHDRAFARKMFFLVHSLIKPRKHNRTLFYRATAKKKLGSREPAHTQTQNHLTDNKFNMINHEMSSFRSYWYHRVAVADDTSNPNTAIAHGSYGKFSSVQ